MIFPQGEPARARVGVSAVQGLIECSLVRTHLCTGTESAHQNGRTGDGSVHREAVTQRYPVLGTNFKDLKSQSY